MGGVCVCVVWYMWSVEYVQLCICAHSVRVDVVSMFCIYACGMCAIVVPVTGMSSVYAQCIYGYSWVCVVHVGVATQTGLLSAMDSCVWLCVLMPALASGCDWPGWWLRLLHTISLPSSLLGTSCSK